MKTGRVRWSSSFIRVRARRNSPQALTKLTMMTMTMPLRTSGNTIPSRVRSEPAPSIRAESTSSFGTVRKTPRIDEDGDCDRQRRIGEHQAPGLVDQAQVILDVEDADQSGDAGREEERGDQKGGQNPAARGIQMDKGVARQHRRDRRDNHGQRRHKNAVLEGGNDSPLLLPDELVVQVDRVDPVLG